MTAPPPPAPPQRMLLSVDEVATELGCGRDTVYRLLTTGAAPLRRRRRTPPPHPHGRPARLRRHLRRDDSVALRRLS